MSLTESLQILGLAISDPDLRVKLRNLRKDNHPDTSGGEFRTPRQKTAYHAADEALIHLGSNFETGTELEVSSTTSLTNSQTAHDILVRERDAFRAELDKVQAISAADDKAISAISEATKEHYSLSLFGGWTAAGISTVILLLDKPLGGLIEEIFRGNTEYAQTAKIILGLVIILGTALSLWSKYQEAQRARRFSSILTDVGTQQLFHSYSYLIFENGPTETTQELSLASLTSAIREYSRIPDHASCEATAEAIIKKLEARNLISKVSTVSFSPKYSIMRETLDSSDWHDFYRFERSDSVPARIKRYVRRNLTKLRSGRKKVD